MRQISNPPNPFESQHRDLLEPADTAKPADTPKPADASKPAAEPPKPQH